MEKISTEMLICSLFKVGFDKIDPVLFTYTLGNISMLYDNNDYIFEEQETSMGFKKYIDDSGIVIKFKDGYTKDTIISQIDNIIIHTVDILFENRKLTEYLSTFNFEEILERKAMIYGVTDINNIYEDFFSEKEINILKKMQAGKGLKKN